MKNTNISFLLLLVTMLTAACQSTPSVPNVEVAPAVKKVKEAAQATTATPQDQSPFAYGIDISKYQGDEITLLNEQKDKLTFVICKATEGITYVDPKFTSNWKSIAEKGFLRGSYHFYRSNDNPINQAISYVRAIKDIKATDLPPIVDFEEGGIDKSKSVETIQSQLLVFLTALEKQINRKPMIYTDLNTSNKYLNNPKFADYALWIAYYSEGTAPKLPVAWKNKKWTIWQRSSTYLLDKNKNDFDVFNGNRTDMLNFIKTY